MNIKRISSLLISTCLMTALCLSTSVLALEHFREGEGAYLNNGAQIQPNSSASGGQVVGNLGREAYAHYDFLVDTPSTCSLKIYYINGDPGSRGARIYVNGNFFSDQIFSATGSWGSISSITINNIPFNQGWNSIYIKGGSIYSEYAPDIDKLVATTNPSASYPTTPTTPTNNTSKQGYITSNGGNVNVRSQPSSTSNIKTSLKYNTPVTLVSKTGNWWYIRYNNNTSDGYVLDTYITESINIPVPTPSTPTPSYQINFIYDGVSSSNSTVTRFVQSFNNLPNWLKKGINSVTFIDKPYQNPTNFTGGTDSNRNIYINIRSPYINKTNSSSQMYYDSIVAHESAHTLDIYNNMKYRNDSFWRTLSTSTKKAIYPLNESDPEQNYTQPRELFAASVQRYLNNTLKSISESTYNYVKDVANGIR